MSPPVWHHVSRSLGSTSDSAKATAHAVPSIRVHLSSQASAASAMLAPPVLWQARAARSAASSLQRPPVSMATTTSRHRLDVRSSGYVASLSRRAYAIPAPSSSAAPGWASPEVLRALRKVMSTANWAPFKHGRSCARTSMRLSSSRPSSCQTKKTLNFTRAPASRHTRASTRSVGDDLFLIRPKRVQAARCLPSGSSGVASIARCFRQGQWKLQALQQQNPEQVRRGR